MTSSKQTGDVLNRFSQQFSELTPGLESLGAELRQQIRAAASATFEKMDLVPREEFEAHKAVLLRTREKLDRLEEQLAELEARLAGDSA